MMSIMITFMIKFIQEFKGEKFNKFKNWQKLQKSAQMTSLLGVNKII